MQKNNFKITTNQYIPSKVEGEPGREVEKYYFIDQNGTLVERSETSASIDSTDHYKLVKDDFLPFQEWQNKSKTIYLKHFSRDKFNWGVFNPLSGYGNPNGGGTGSAWDGFGYYDLTLKDEVIFIKMPCTNRSVFLSNDYDFDTGLHYYKLPEPYNANIDVSFLLYVKNFELHSIYSIRRK